MSMLEKMRTSVKTSKKSKKLAQDSFYLPAFSQLEQVETEGPEVLSESKAHPQ